jgi:ketosteroid isomerase-like protein
VASGRCAPVRGPFRRETIVEGDLAAVKYRFAVVSDEGARLERSGCAFVTFEDGTIVEWREYEG